MSESLERGRVEDGRGQPAAPGAGGDPSGGGEAPPPPAELEARLAATEDRLLRALADLDNQRKRVGREIERGRAEAYERVLRDWLEVVDSADRALRAFADRSEDPMYAGLAALVGQMEDVLRRQDVRRLGARGERFDPEQHEAVGTAPAAGLPDGSVVAVARPGYAMDARLLRPAQVIVARGGGDGA